jgi:uncharacterized protein (TIGR03437 family)
MNEAIFNVKIFIKLKIAVRLLVLTASGTVLAQQVTLSVGSGTATPGTSVTVPITMTTSGGAQPAGLQWTMGYSSSDISNVSAMVGSGATAANKSVTCSSSSTATICLAYGINTNVISTGTVANVTFTIASSSLDTSSPIQVTGVMATDATGTVSISASGTGGTLTIPQPTAPTLSGLSCTPTTVNAAGISACTVTLSGAALTGGFVVGVTSNNSNVTVPASVIVVAGATSIGFSATVSATLPTSQTAVLTVSAAGVSKTVSLNLLSATWNITGGVGTAGNGATLTLTGTSTATTTANASGAYTFTGLANGSYTVTPSLSGYTFSPASAAVTVNGANATVPNFIATAQTWTITGGVGTTGSGATIALTGASTATTTASSSGSYTFTGLANGSYTVTPSLTGYTFSPASAAVTVNGANAMAGNFTATAQTWTITGGVGTTGSGATIALTGVSTATTTASSSGSYTFTGLANGSYTATPSLTGYTFSPASAAVTVNGANATAPNFTATAQTWTITGGVGTTGSGATIALTGASTVTTTANAPGAYTFTGLANGSYTVTPSLSGYTFSPASQAVTVNGANVTVGNFILQGAPASITIDATVSEDQSTLSSSIAVSGLSTVSGNELFLALVATGAIAGKRENSPVMVTGVSGGGLTWVLVNRTQVQRGTAEIWSAFAPTPLTGVSITATLSDSIAASMTVMSFAGVNTNGTNGSGAIGATGSGNASSGAPQAALITTYNNSLVIGVGTDTSNANARTVGSGQTIVHQYLASVSNTYWVQQMNSTTAASGSSVTISDSAPTSDPYNLSIVEILAAPSAAGQTTGLVTPAVVAATAKATSRSNGVAPGLPLVLATITTGQEGAACSPGGLASLLGAGLTGTQTERSTSQPLPTQLAGVQVLVNSIPAPLLLASNAQINFQCPVLPQGTTMEIQVESANGVLTSALQTVMQAAVPLLFQLDASGRALVTIAGTNEIAMATTDGIPSRPAILGEYLTIHASGLGEVVDGVAAGTAAPLNRPVPTKSQITLVLGDIEIDPEFAGLAPGTVGLYQVNAQVPVETPAGSAVPLYLKMTLPDGTIFRSNIVTVAVAEATKE